MSVQKINAALVTALQGVNLGIPIGWAGKEFRPPAGAPYARFKNFPAGQIVQTLGDRGEDNITGFAQIDVYVPADSGTGTLDALTDKIKKQFKNGRRFIYNEQEVKIRRIAFTPGSNLMTHTIYWDSPTQR